MAKNFTKAERNVKIDGEYQLLSYASSSESVEMTDGTNLQSKMDSVDKNISDETTRATAKETEIADNLSSHTSNTSNPHSVTKAQVGLGNVENKSSATIRGEITKSNVTTALGYTPLNQNLKGANSGLAELDANGKVPSSQLPSYVDDVLEYSAKSSFPSTGETGKIYVDTSTNLTYRWSGSAYVEISPSLALGETSSTAYRGDRGKIAYDHSQSTHARTDATNVVKSTTNGNIKINGTETTVYTHPGSGTNPHGTTKSDVGLGNVDNTSDVNKPISTAQQAEFDSLNNNLSQLEIDLKMLGYTVPKEMPVQNYVDSDGVYHQRVGRVDLGTLDWNSYTFDTNDCFYALISDRKNISSKIYTDAYTTVSKSPNILGDKEMNGNSNGKYVYIKDTRYGKDVTAFKNANKGVYLYYELAEEKTIKVDGNEAVTQLTADVAELKNDLSEKAPSNHTHKYAGSSSVGGSANSAVKLDSSAGSATQPVYFSSGKPTACTYTLGKSVPSDAKFTDTWRPLGTTADTACAGNDSRLSNARPASDVYSWAKASSKPSYSWSEITSKPSTFTPASHTHSAYVNQNAFSNITVGSTTVSADSATDTLTLVAGSNVTITPDATNDKITIAATNTVTTATTTGSGNAVTAITASNGALTVTKGSTFLTAHQDISGKMDKANPTGTGSFSLNRKSGTEVGTNSTAEGYNTTASGGYSHAEGGNTRASGGYSHAEGNHTIADGISSHAEGNYAIANGGTSHAEGGDTRADGIFSHVEGYHTIASGDYQHVQGKFNVEDTTSAFIIGNGTSSSAKSNAMTVDWNGNLKTAGDITNGSGVSLNSLNSKIVKYVDKLTEGIGANIKVIYNDSGIVQVYGYLLNLDAKTTIDLGTTRFKPSTTPYVTIPVLNHAVPYNSVGAVWIDTSGKVTLYKPTNTSGCYVSGCYYL